MKISIVLLVLVINVSFALSNQIVVINKPVTYVETVEECPKENTGGVLVVIAHETDCDKFYVCIDGEKVLEDCPDGLHFDPKHGNCNWPEEVNCQLTSPRPNSTEATGAPTSQATSQKPTTSEGTRSTSSEATSEGTSSSEVTRPPSSEATSQRPSSTAGARPPSSEATSKRPSSTVGTRPPSSEATSQRPSSTDGTRPPLSTSQRPSSTTQKPTTTKKPSRPTSCPKYNTTVPVLLAHECVCSKYYICQRGEQILRKCPVGLHFNPDAQDCELPEEAGCIKPTPTPPSLPPIPTGCPPWVGSETIHIAHERNCSLFYTCTHAGEKIVQECPAGLYFNPKLQICDWPYNVNCSNKPPIPTSTNNPWRPTTARSRHIVNKREVNSEYLWQSSSEATTTTTKAWQNPGTCIGKCPLFDPQNYTVQLPNIRCSKFCKCSNGQAYVFSCPANLHYNVKLKVCDWPHNANCTGIGGIISTTTEKPEISTSTGKPNTSSSEKPVMPTSTGKPDTSSKWPEISSSSGKPNTSTSTRKPEATQPPTIYLI